MTKVKPIRLWPKSLANQFMAVLALVLILAQIINLALLVGERRLVSQSNIQNLAMEKVMSDLSSLDLSQPLDVSKTFNPATDIVGGFFLSEESVADRAPDTYEMPRLQNRFLSLMDNIGLGELTGQNIRVVMQEDGALPNDVNAILDEMTMDLDGNLSAQQADPMAFPRPRGPGGMAPMAGPGGPPPESTATPQSGTANSNVSPELEARNAPAQSPTQGPQGQGMAPMAGPGGPMGGPGGGGPSAGPMGGGANHSLPYDLVASVHAARSPGGMPDDASIRELIISIEVQPNIWYNALVPHIEVEAITPRIVLATAILLLLTLLVAWFFVRRLTRPLENFSHAAHRFGRGDGSVILSESGPEEIREAATAFNMMQRRLTRMIDSQRTMLQAVGHDLRTPLTAMRLRAENLKDKTSRDALVQSIDNMSDMTREILSWAKDVSAGEEMVMINFNSLIQSVCDNYVDQGLPVSFEEMDAKIVKVRRVSLRRALGNLIDNALKYGKTAKVSTSQPDHFICIHIDDKGPGIPEDQLKNAVKPFVRLESSRSKATGGTGLGLSLAETIVQAQGGKLILENRAQGGLRATLYIPT